MFSYVPTHVALTAFAVAKFAFGAPAGGRRRDLVELKTSGLARLVSHRISYVDLRFDEQLIWLKGVACFRPVFAPNWFIDDVRRIGCRLSVSPIHVEIDVGNQPRFLRRRQVVHLYKRRKKC